MDPVFLLDSEAWASIEKPVPNTEPYVLLYDFDRNPEMVRFARRMAEENGWKLYSVLSCKECDRCFEQDGPLTFLNLVHHAQFVVSNSFHATAFSLIFRKQFVVFNRQEHINTRMRDLLYGLGLRDCLTDSAGRDCRGSTTHRFWKSWTSRWAHPRRTLRTSCHTELQLGSI